MEVFEPRPIGCFRVSVKGSGIYNSLLSVLGHYFTYFWGSRIKSRVSGFRV